MCIQSTVSAVSRTLQVSTDQYQHGSVAVWEDSEIDVNISPDILKQFVQNEESGTRYNCK